MPQCESAHRGMLFSLWRTVGSRVSEEQFRCAAGAAALVQHGRVGRVERAGAHGAELDAGAALGAERDVGRGAAVVQTDGPGGAEVHALAATVAQVVYYGCLRGCGADSFSA